VGKEVTGMTDLYIVRIEDDDGIMREFHNVRMDNVLIDEDTGEVTYTLAMFEPIDPNEKILWEGIYNAIHS
jgi:hypothetical protein